MDNLDPGTKPSGSFMPLALAHRREIRTGLGTLTDAEGIKGAKQDTVDDAFELGLLQPWSSQLKLHVFV